MRLRPPILRSTGVGVAAVCVLLTAVGTAAQTAFSAQRVLGDGAWSWFADPRGVRYDGSHKRTYVGWVAQDGDVKVSAYDHDTLSRTTVVLASRLQVDDHANPAIQVLPDGRLRVYYSAHYGDFMSYRTTRNPEDITSWDAPLTIPVNSPGTKGYTYPNPIHLSAERVTYLFWRGGNHNPTFSTQADGATTWSPARTLVFVSGQRPYIKYDTNGTDAIYFAFTNAHPASVSDVNIYYAAYRAGGIFRANGTRIANLGTAIAPSQADTVYDTSRKAWVHDIAVDAAGRPVIVFASFASTSDHRYMYSRWTGTRWQTSEITAAGSSISLDGKEPYYSAGITLDHEDPSTVYLSRLISGIYEVETWKTTDGGATWSRQAVTSGDTVNNVRPISPRGLIPFSGDMSVVWIRGIYNSYVDYKTSIATILATGGNSAPIADAELTPRSGTAPQQVSFDGTPSRDPDGSVASWSWDFGDGAQGSGAQVTHTYTAPGRYFPKLTVTDNAGATDVFVAEILVQPGAAPSATTGAASAITANSATLSATVNPHNQATTYHFDYGPTTAYGSTTAAQAVSPTDDATHAVTTAVTGLAAGQAYHYRIVATNATGTTTGADNTFTTTPPPPSAYRDAVLATPGLVGYWRLGERTGAVATDEKGANPGTYTGAFALGDTGALTGDPDTAAGFDGSTGEMTAPAGGLGAAGTLEGWFDWRAGVALLRDNTAGGGWIIAYDNGGGLSYRVGGTTFNTGRTVASVQSSWHYIALTKNGANVSLYLDGTLVHTGSGAGATAPVMPWHVMRNGTFAQYAQGHADEVAIYGVALPASTITQHWNAGHGP
jgi:PKD repeat protein